MSQLQYLIDNLVVETRKDDSSVVQKKIELKDGDYFNNLSNNTAILQSRPWKDDLMYFSKVHISSLATMKMAIHAISGGNIEIMGMLVGKIDEGIIVVDDVYSLPVEGTETRVNAQSEGYEYMVQYLESNKAVKPDQNIVGWYHSHPGYGCWLSGIDVATQSLNQNFQDPYLAIVVDPIKSAKQGKIEIGAFRTFPDENVNPENKSDPRNKSAHPDKAKFGIHSNQYYSLDIEIFKSSREDELIKLINKQTWINDLISSKDIKTSSETEKIKNITYLLNEIGFFKDNEKRSIQTKREFSQAEALIASIASKRGYAQLGNTAARSSRFRLNNAQFNAMFIKHIHEFLIVPETDKIKRDVGDDMIFDDDADDGSEGDDSDDGLEDDDGETSEDNLSIRNKKFSAPKPRVPKFVGTKPNNLFKDINEVDEYVNGICQQELRDLVQEQKKRSIFS